eukprot:Skav202638  [mRNA]  locus=scaffold1942:39978:40178:- [translate_table: standard]
MDARSTAARDSLVYDGEEVDLVQLREQIRSEQGQGGQSGLPLRSSTLSLASLPSIRETDGRQRSDS